MLLVLNVEEGSGGLRPLRLVNLGNTRRFSYENYHTNSGQKKRNKEIYIKKKRGKQKRKQQMGVQKYPTKRDKKKRFNRKVYKVPNDDFILAKLE